MRRTFEKDAQTHTHSTQNARPTKSEPAAQHQQAPDSFLALAATLADGGTARKWLAEGWHRHRWRGDKDGLLLLVILLPLRLWEGGGVDVIWYGMGGDNADDVLPPSSFSPRVGECVWVRPVQVTSSELPPERGRSAIQGVEVLMLLVMMMMMVMLLMVVLEGQRHEAAEPREIREDECYTGWPWPSGPAGPPPAASNWPRGVIAAPTLPSRYLSPAPHWPPSAPAKRRCGDAPCLPAAVAVAQASPSCLLLVRCACFSEVREAQRGTWGGQLHLLGASSLGARHELSRAELHGRRAPLCAYDTIQCIPRGRAENVTLHAGAVAEERGGGIVVMRRKVLDYLLRHPCWKKKYANAQSGSCCSARPCAVYLVWHTHSAFVISTFRQYDIQASASTEACESVKGVVSLIWHRLQWVSPERSTVESDSRLGRRRAAPEGEAPGGWQCKQDGAIRGRPIAYDGFRLRQHASARILAPQTLQGA
ncbi:hypothetical protein DFH27DRAFT_603105 [Peziza echinospora]|nr:hypothetical protein DFH27DRAFT_603105 [Peziza echinospora]